jgi:rfaE bifunctional protein nucleotidyltransferase chain/domain
VAESKIRDLSELAAHLAGVRAGRRVVQCHGVFDLLHVGHVRHFQEAKKQGDLLVVTVTPDRFVNKGPHRPVFPEGLRAEMIAALDCVDFVAINQWPSAVEAIGLIKPDLYAKGADYRDAAADHTGGIARERAAVEAAGGRLVFTDEITFSSSTLLNRHMPVFSEDVNNFLAAFRQRHTADDVTSFLKRARSLKVLVLGEAIIDEYQYCETLGKSGKEPILAAQYIRQEQFIGGVLAIANHVAAGSDHVSLLTMLGDHDSHEDLIRQKLSPAVSPTFVTMSGAPTLVKRRFIETYPFQKLFEIYVMDEDAAQRESKTLCAILDKTIGDYDVVIVGDYGHGVISPDAVDLLCSRAKFLAVNAQVNAGNHGFNTVSKYRRADFVSLSEKEIRLEARNPSGDLRTIVENVARSLECPRVLITRGNEGSLCYSAEHGFFTVPGFAIKTVDRVGAGDAVFSIASLCAAVGAPMEVIGLIGNAVGTEAVGIVGNQRFIERAPLMKHIEALLK